MNQIFHKYLVMLDHLLLLVSRYSTSDPFTSNNLFGVVMSYYTITPTTSNIEPLGLLPQEIGAYGEAYEDHHESVGYGGGEINFYHQESLWTLGWGSNSSYLTYLIPTVLDGPGFHHKHMIHPCQPKLIKEQRMIRILYVVYYLKNLLGIDVFTTTD